MWIFLDVAGPSLPDDTCLLVLDWHGGHGGTRHTTAGADPYRASTPHHGVMSLAQEVDHQLVEVVGALQRQHV